MSAKPIFFEDFQPGLLMGECVEVYDTQQAQRWQAIFGAEVEQAEESETEAASMAVVSMMRAYLNVVAPRPAGNVHARQRLNMHTLPTPGEAIRVSVTCAGKELRRDRKYVELLVQGCGAGNRPLFDGLITLIWAA